MTEPIVFADLKRVMDSINNLQEHGGPDGHDGNLIKIWDDLQPSFQGEPYCAATDCYIWKHAGRPYDPIDHPWGFSYCPDAADYFKRKNMWSEKPPYAPGDTIFFVEQGIAGHTGTVVHDDEHTILTFEGNTSPDGGFGSQNDGGGCYYRHRQHGSFVMGVAKTSLWLNQPKPAEVRKGVPAAGKKVPPKGVGTYTEDDMQILLRGDKQPDLFQSDGKTKLHLKSFDEANRRIAAGLVQKSIIVWPQAEVDNIPVQK